MANLMIIHFFDLKHIKITKDKRAIQIRVELTLNVAMLDDPFAAAQRVIVEIPWSDAFAVSASITPNARTT